MQRPHSPLRVRTARLRGIARKRTSATLNAGSPFVAAPAAPPGLLLELAGGPERKPRCRSSRRTKWPLVRESRSRAQSRPRHRARQSCVGRCGRRRDARTLLRFARTSSDVGVDDGGCSATRATARCACTSPRIRPRARTSVTAATAAKEGSRCGRSQRRTVEGVEMRTFGEERVRCQARIETRVRARACTGGSHGFRSCLRLEAGALGRLSITRLSLVRCERLERRST